MARALDCGARGHRFKSPYKEGVFLFQEKGSIKLLVAQYWEKFHHEKVQL